MTGEMSTVQRLFTALVPESWGERMRKSSEGWRIRCSTCGNSRSVWEAGGIRWGAASVGKRTRVHCSHCGTTRWAVVEWKPDESGQTSALK